MEHPTAKSTQSGGRRLPKMAIIATVLSIGLAGLMLLRVVNIAWAQSWASDTESADDESQRKAGPDDSREDRDRFGACLATAGADKDVLLAGFSMLPADVI